MPPDCRVTAEAQVPGRDRLVTLPARGGGELPGMHRIGIVGVSYRHATAGQVAQFAVARDAVAHRLGVLCEALKGAEVLYLTTCNRVEVIYATAGPAVDRRAEIFQALIGRAPVNGEATSSLRC